MEAAPQLPALSPAERRRYGRHLVIPEVGEAGQRKLKAAKVLLVGAGGLGSPLALYLAAAGVGRLGIVEFDTVDESNLQRQVLYGHPDVGRAKLDVARERLHAINPHVTVEPHAERLTASNALALIEGYDVVADGSDNFACRYLVNDACVRLGKPDVWGAISRFEGQLSVFWAARGPCYRCLFPEPPPPGVVPSCAEAGVLGILPGIVGCLQANEVVKLLLGIGEPMIGRLLVFDALGLRFRELKLRKDAGCPVCGEAPSLVELVEYTEHCGIAAAQPAGTEETMEPMEIEVSEVARWRQEGRDFDLLDVRQPDEHAVAAIAGAKLIPLQELPQRLDELDRSRPLVVHCHHGMRSLHAVQLLRSRGFDKAQSMRGGIDAWTDEVDSSVPRY
jgi:molybdopterin/thiamine biosynthesis adenylyltransferase/rhodanese-related sulfurtransferase